MLSSKKIIFITMMICGFIMAACGDSGNSQEGESVSDDADVTKNEADQKDETKETKNTSDTADTSDTSDTSDTADTSDTEDTSDTADTSDTEDTSDTADTSDTEDTSDTGDTSDTADTSDTGSDTGKTLCAECTENEFCKVENCDDTSGECLERPQICTRLWDPVCGCDGQTYSNECVANSMGVWVDYKGECDEVIIDPCGGCREGQFCKVENCNDEKGTCEDLPDACLPVYKPVCGCDGKTYSNECSANTAGVSVDFAGECENSTVPVDKCGGCLKEEFCLLENCDAERGVCTVIPNACPTVIDPVCGCDGETYSNECVAHSAQMSIAYKGECTFGGACFNDGMCGADFFCQFNPCAIETGYCMQKTSVCRNVYDPVCSCSGVQYSNSCYAAMDGAAHEPGLCEGSTCTSNDECIEGLFCDNPGCGLLSKDQKGQCTRIPTRSDCQKFIGDSVCGCDGQIYSNECIAHANSVSVLNHGKVCLLNMGGTTKEAN